MEQKEILQYALVGAQTIWETLHKIYKEEPTALNKKKEDEAWYKIQELEEMYNEA